MMKMLVLQKMGEPIKNRKIEADIRPSLFEDLARSIQKSYKVIEQYRNNDERYNHIAVSGNFSDLFRSKFESYAKGNDSFLFSGV